MQPVPMSTKPLSAFGEPMVGWTPPLDVRSRSLRKMCVDAIGGAGRGHLPSALSLIEVLRVLYDDIMRYRPA